VDFNFHQAHFRGPAGNSVIQRPAKEVRKNRYDVGLHFAEPKTIHSRARTGKSANPNSASSFALLLLLLFRGHGRINFQQALRQLHAHLFAGGVDRLQIRFGKGHIEPFARFTGNN
jgi:hypothetical protein